MTEAVVKKGWQCNWPLGEEHQKIYNEGEVIDITGFEEEAKHIEALLISPEETSALKGDTEDNTKREPSYQELKALAKKLGIEGYSTMKKDELVEAINAKQEETE